MQPSSSHRSRIPRIAAAIIASAWITAGPPARAQSAASLANPSAAADLVAPQEINGTLKRLAMALAGALDEPAVRTFLHRHLESAAGDVRLRDLLYVELTDGSTLAARLAHGYLRAPANKGLAADHGAAIEAIASIFERMPNVDLSAPVNFVLWDPESQAPLVSFTEEGIPDSARTTVRLFEAGADMQLRGVDELADLVRPVLVLEYHEVGFPPAPDAPPALEAGGLPNKVGPSCATTTSYKSYPLISEAGCFDAHEGCCNGPEGFLYFTAAGTEKTGNLPSSLGGRSGWATNVWGSNFQGPRPVYAQRWQWEWTSDGWWEYSHRLYPAMFAQQSKTSASNLSSVDYTIKEDDEWPNGDDYVGKVRIDHGYCKTDVFDQGLSSGWSNLHTSPQVNDIKDVDYELYCSTSQSFTCSLICNSWGDKVICTGSGSCSGCQAGPDWVQCNGGARFYCDELWE